VRNVAKIFISEIQPNQEVATSFIVTEKQLRVARNGTQFLTLKLVDKTGEITGRIWERAEEIAQTISAKGVVFLRARSETFREELQLQIQEISPVSVSEIDPSDFLPVCPLSTEILFEKLKKLTGGIKRRSLHQLMVHIFGDRELVGQLKRAPAAKAMHHAYLGGLLEHTVSVVGLVSQICKNYSDLDRDLLIAGAVFHDLGKIHEFVYDLYIDYSNAGRLLGHMVLGVRILEEKIDALKSFPEEDALLLKHLILSHHGQVELGAVRLPMTREAFVLHFADDLDAKMNSLTRILSESKGADDAWTSYQPLFERFFFKGLPQAAENSLAAPADLPEEDQGVQLSLWQQMEKKRKADA